MLRTITGIIVGYLIFAVPSYLLFRVAHVDPHAHASTGFEIFSIVYGIVFALLGGYVGTAIAGRRTMWVALTIAALMAAGAIASMVATGVNWSPIAALICMVPAAVAGGWLRFLQQSSGVKGI